MRAELWAMTALLIVPVVAQQRGVVSGVAVPKAPAQAGVPIEITVTGRNPCGAVRIDPGTAPNGSHTRLHRCPPQYHMSIGRRDGSRCAPRAWATATAWRRPAFRSIPHPPRGVSRPPPAVPAPGSVRDMDTDRDGVVTRAEWRGSDQAFRNHDTNGDGVLSGAEVRDEPGEVIVTAAERWTSTGVYVRDGDVVRIDSAGTVQLSADAADTSSPGGAGSRRRAPAAPMPDRPAGGLIARIGDGPPLFVGADSMLRANATGQLYLGVNDDYLSDNRGGFRVKVAVPSGGRHRR